MLWHAQHGRDAPANRAALEARGAPVPSYMHPPEMLPGVAPWFMAFWELSTDRRFPGGPIPHASIAAWPTDDPQTFADCIRACDAAYLDFINKPADERKSLPVLQPGTIKGKTK